MMIKWTFGNILRRKGRSLFAILGIGIGISAVISLSAVSEGLIEGVQGMLNNLPGSHLILEKGSPGIPFSSLDDSVVEKIRKIDGVEWAEPFLFQMRKIPAYTRHSVLTGSAEENGELVDRMVPIFGFKIDGKAIKQCKIEEGCKGISKEGIGDMKTPIQFLIGKDIEAAWKKHANKELPDEFEIFIFKFKLAGVFYANNFMRATIVMAYEDAQFFMNKKNSCSGISINIKDGFDEAEVLKEIRAVSDIIEPIASDKYLGSYEELQWLEQMIGLIGLIAAFAGAASVLITMVSNVHERTREIGLLMAVGWKPSKIVIRFIFEGITLSFIGGIVACILGVIEVEAFSFRFDFSPVPEGFPLWAFSKGMILSVLLGAIGSSLPAIRAARMSPVEALRYE